MTTQHKFFPEVSVDEYMAEYFKNKDFQGYATWCNKCGEGTSIGLCRAKSRVKNCEFLENRQIKNTEGKQ